MGKTKIDKDALVPSAKLTFLTGLLQGIKGAVDTQKAKEIEKQKQQFAMMKFLLPLQQKHRQFEAEQKTAFAGLEQRASQFETKLSFEKEDKERDRNLQIQLQGMRNELATLLKGIGITATSQQQALTQFFEVNMQEDRQREARDREEDRQRFEDFQRVKGEGFVTSERVAAQRERRAIDVKTDFDASVTRGNSIREEMAKDVSAFGSKEKLAIEARDEAERTIALWKTLALEAEETNAPLPPIPKELEIYKDESWFKRITKIFGKTEFRVAPKTITPASAVLSTGQAKITNNMQRMIDLLNAGALPELWEVGVHDRFDKKQADQIIREVKGK